MGLKDVAFKYKSICAKFMSMWEKQILVWSTVLQNENLG